MTNTMTREPLKIGDTVTDADGTVGRVVGVMHYPAIPGRGSSTGYQIQWLPDLDNNKETP